MPRIAPWLCASLLPGNHEVFRDAPKGSMPSLQFPHRTAASKQVRPKVPPLSLDFWPWPQVVWPHRWCVSMDSSLVPYSFLLKRKNVQSSRQRAREKWTPLSFQTSLFQKKWAFGQQPAEDLIVSTNTVVFVLMLIIRIQHPMSTRTQSSCRSSPRFPVCRFRPDVCRHECAQSGETSTRIHSCGARFAECH
jgi:hypothetical protein